MKLLQRLVEALGANYSQWRVLSRVMWKIDLRKSGAALDTGRRKRNSFFWTLVGYGFFGVFAAIVVGAVPGLLLSATVALTMLGVTVCGIILLDFHAVVVSPDDHAVLGHQPVSSRTCFVVKLTNVLLHTGIIGALVGGPAVIPFLTGHGLAVAAAWLVAVAGTTVASTVAMISVYAGLLSRVSADRMSRALSYAQLLLVTIFAVGALFYGEVMDALAKADVPLGALLLFPPAWFASLLTLASGDWAGSAVATVLAALAATAGLVYVAAHRLSLSYSERLGALLSAKDAGRSSRWTNGLLARRLSPELRVVATLMRAQFRHEMKFRLAILGLLPLTVFYVLMGLQDGPLPDPFNERGFAAMELFPIHMVAVLTPLTLVDSCFRSDSYRGAWVFFVSPVDRGRLVIKVGDCVALFFLLPYAALLGVVLAWSFGDIRHGIAHAAVLGLFARLVVQLRIAASPHLPFSRPSSKGEFSGSLFGAMMLGLFAIGVVFPLVLGVAYSTTGSSIVMVGVLLGAGVLMSAGGPRRVRPRVEALEFLD